MKIIIINGPNLNLLGKRQPEIYGDKDFESFFNELKNKYPDIQLDYYQSNHEGELIDKIHEVGFIFDGIIINAGGYTHTSIALGDAIASIKTPVIEVHVSNIFSREEFRRISYLSPFCKAIISGCGLHGYEYALMELFFKRS